MYEDSYLDSYWENINEPYFGAYGDDDRYEDDSDRYGYDWDEYDDDEDERINAIYYGE